MKILVAAILIVCAVLCVASVVLGIATGYVLFYPVAALAAAQAAWAWWSMREIRQLDADDAKRRPA